jgi:hypothetical protein
MEKQRVDAMATDHALKIRITTAAMRQATLHAPFSKYRYVRQRTEAACSDVQTALSEH